MINQNYFDTFHLGMSAQLKELSLDEMVDYVRSHIHSFLLCESVCFCFIERLANDPATASHEKASRTLLYLLDKALQVRPFRPGLLDAVARLTRNEQIVKRKTIVEALNQDKETYDLISGLNRKHDIDDARKFIAQLVEAHPTHVAGAQLALSLDRHTGRMPGPWLDAFQCPATLRRDWDIALFNHYAALCAYDKARELWAELSQDMLREHTLNLAAEMFIAEGDVETGLELYERSLQQDPRQTPVKLRMRELKAPFAPDHSLPGACSVNILLYSWNKAEMLEQTLLSLSESDIGEARIDVLLNGCTDDSLERVEKVRERFPDNELVVHNLHVNIGAPAARNWLMNLPQVQQNDYVAFLDDDVTVQKDWLAHFLTIAESDKTVGVVGCKTVHPGEPVLFQYLYRYVAIADHGLLKMSIDTPNRQFDTHVYDVIRECRNVMGCQHLLRVSALNDVPAGFDIRFSPSQVDDIDHDLEMCLKGHRIMYTGLVTCVHHQSSGANILNNEYSPARIGGIMGNDIKFFFKHAEGLGKIKALDNLGLDQGVDLPDF